MHVVQVLRREEIQPRVPQLWRQPGAASDEGRQGMTRKQVILAIVILSASLSAVSWTYRTILEFSPYQNIWFYLITPILFWALLAGPLFLMLNDKRYIRVLAGILLVPTSILWVLSVIVGFFGLKIH